MLVLTRRPGESIWIDESIEVMVLGINAFGKARIGISAPPAVSIRRDEIDRPPDAEARELAAERQRETAAP